MPRITGHNSPVMKARNRSAVLRLLLQQGPIPRRDIAERLGLTPATITNVARELIGLGLVRERPDLDVVPAAVTKKPIPIEIDADGAFAIGINLGSTGAGVGMVDLQGVIRASEPVVYAERQPDVVVGQIVGIVERLVESAGIEPRRVIGVGVGVAGVIDPATGLIRSHLGLGWHDVPFGEMLSRTLGRRAAIANNVHAMTVSEQLYGVAAHVENFALVFVSTVIGAGLVTDGHLHLGRQSAAGLIGHTCVVPGGPLCRCGNRGCLDAVASNAALLREAAQAIADGQPTAIRDLAAGADKPPTIQTIHEAAERGDRLAADLLRRQARYVGSSIATLLHLLDPDLVVLAAPVLQLRIDLGGEDFLAVVRRVAREEACLLDVPDTRIVASRFGADATIRGAAAIVLAEFVNTAPFAELRRPAQLDGLRLAFA